MLIPDHETAVDLLNYQAISRTINSLLQKNREKPVTIGVHGSWGAGKSSVLKMIEEDISQNKDTLCLWFNGWTFQGFDDAKTVLIETIVEELRRKRSSTGKVKEISASLLKRIDWLKVTKKAANYAVTATTGIPTLEILNDFKEVLAGLKDASPEDVQEGIKAANELLNPVEPTSVPEVMHQFREEFQELLEAAQIKQLVILIDDLDRCLPKTAIETLEAIRLFLFVPKSAFIVAADEAMIEYSVKQHFPDLPYSHEPTSYARNYLEKLIQVPFRIPSMGAQETKAYITLLLVQNIVGEEHTGFKELLDATKQKIIKPWDAQPLRLAEIEAVDAAYKPELSEAFLIGQQIGEKLTEGTSGNPRQIKRFLNSMLLRTAIADALGFGEKIDQKILAKLMLAEMSHKDFYDDLSRLVINSPTGVVKDLKFLEEAEDKPLKWKSKKDEETEELIPENVQKWVEQRHLKSWAVIEPSLQEIDLRPYVFVARDKRLIIADGVGIDKLSEIKQNLLKGKIAAAGETQKIKGLLPDDVERLFQDLREELLKSDTTTSEPKALIGLKLIAEHHQKHQPELLQTITGIESKKLGVWVTKGWGKSLSSSELQKTLQDFLVELSKQTENPVLKKAAQSVLTTQRNSK
jgi:hypothetical protein